MSARTTLLPVASALALVTCLFDGEETRGLPCTKDEQCGVQIDCIDGLCGGIDACATGIPTCSGPDIVQECVGGIPTDFPCDDVCASNGLGRALACAHSVQDGEDGCYCDQASTFCDFDGAYECWSDDDLRYCDGGAWLNLDCDFVCDFNDLGSGVSCGFDMGEPVCYCQDPCVDGEQYCAGTDTLAYCNGGGWTQAECLASGCESGVSLGCAWASSLGDEACLCAA